MSAKILRLNKAGVPISWLTRQETATLLVKDQVIWSLGDTVMEIRGGINRGGVQSVLKLPSIIACDALKHTFLGIQNIPSIATHPVWPVVLGPDPLWPICLGPGPGPNGSI